MTFGATAATNIRKGDTVVLPSGREVVITGARTVLGTIRVVKFDGGSAELQGRVTVKV